MKITYLEHKYKIERYVIMQLYLAITDEYRNINEVFDNNCTQYDMKSLFDETIKKQKKPLQKAGFYSFAITFTRTYI